MKTAIVNLATIVTGDWARLIKSTMSPKIGLCLCRRRRMGSHTAAWMSHMDASESVAMVVWPSWSAAHMAASSAREIVQDGPSPPGATRWVAAGWSPFAGM